MATCSPAFNAGMVGRVGIGLVTILFYLAHLSHAYATLAFVPFFLAHGLTMGLLVFYTRSIVPGIVLHAVSDLHCAPNAVRRDSVCRAVGVCLARLATRSWPERRDSGVPTACKGNGA